MHLQISGLCKSECFTGLNIFIYLFIYFNLTTDKDGNIRSTVNNMLLSGRMRSWKKSQGQKSNTSQNSSFQVKSSKSQTCSCNVSIICGVDSGWNVCFRARWKKVSHRLWSDGPLSQIKQGSAGTALESTLSLLYVLVIKYRLMVY